MFLETKDASVVLSYAGLGLTIGGTEPADWMSAVLRGRSLPLNQTLGVLADAMQREMPPHVASVSPAHFLVVAGFLNEEPRLYVMDLRINRDGSSRSFAWNRIVMDVNATPQRSARIVIAGSGTPFLMKDRRWVREVLRLIVRYERQQLSATAVADFLASINQRVSLTETTVGPHCIVAYRDRPGAHAVRLGPGKGVFAYNGTNRKANAPNIPLIANGLNLGGMIAAMMPVMIQRARDAFVPEKLQATFDAIWEAADRVSQEPDEKLK